MSAPEPRLATLDRRGLLVGGLSALGALALAPRARGAGGGADRTLVLVQLSGGNDGLSTVVPYGDDAYGRARRATRIDARDVLRLDDYRGLHPNLGALRELYDQGRLALVEGVGHPGPGRSHFKALDIWHAASERGREAGDGWVGRLAAHAWPAAEEPELLVHVGKRVPYALHSSTRGALAFELPETYRWLGAAEERAAYAEEARRADEQPAGGVLGRLREVQRDAHESSARVRRAVGSYRTRVEYPDDAFGRGLRTIAALIDARLGARVLSIELGGFDTHRGQKPNHDALMRTLDRGLGAFLADLRGREAGDQALVVAFSEFGRRVAENGSGGTDHGKAAPVLVAGSGVRGGLYGAHPSLTELDEGDLRFTTDFRAVYATAIEGWFGLPSEPVLGARYAPLPLLRRA